MWRLCGSVAARASSAAAPVAARRTFMAKGDTTISIIGAPSSHGQLNDSAALGPQSLRDAGVASRLEAIGWAVTDRGDVTFPPKDTSREGNIAAIVEGNRQLSDEVYDAYLESDTSLILGGDHSISIGSVSGVLRRNPEIGVLWIDAHCDINTYESSTSKSMHGMVLSYLMKLQGIGPFGWLSDVPKLHAKQLAFIGARDIDPYEKRTLKNLGIEVYTMHTIDKYGIAKVTEMALDHLDGRNLHVSYDIDATDPGVAPSTGTPVRGGLTYREAHFIAEEISATGRMRSMDMVEVDPILSKARNETVDIAATLIESAFGKVIL